MNTEKNTIERLFENKNNLTKDDIEVVSSSLMQAVNLISELTKEISNMKLVIDSIYKKVFDIEQSLGQFGQNNKQPYGMYNHDASKLPYLPGYDPRYQNPTQQYKPQQPMNIKPKQQAFDPFSVPNIQSQDGSVQAVPQFNGKKIS